MKLAETEAKILKALTHPARMAILNELRQDEQCVCHLEARLGYRQAYISQQMMVLREAGLVEDRRDGWNIFYRVVEPRIFNILDTTSEIASGINSGAQPAPPSHSRQQPGASETCPCPKCNPHDESGRC